MADDGQANLIRQLKPRDLASYFRRESKDRGANTVSTELFHFIEQETLPPTVYKTFLTSVKPLDSLIEGLSKPFSSHVRHVAIAQFGKFMRSADWQLAWAKAGNTEGLLKLFAQMSVVEVYQLSKAIGRCKGRSKDPGEERKIRITELLEGLLPSIYPNSAHQSSDQRPLHRQYAQMVPACTSSFVGNLFLQDSHPLFEHVSGEYIAMYHLESTRRLVSHAVLKNSSMKSRITESILTKYLPPLVKSIPPLPTLQSGFSASMIFTTNILEKLATHSDAHVPERLLVKDLIPSLMHRLKRRHIHWTQIQHITNLVIEILRRDKRARDQLGFAQGSLIAHVAGFWSRNPVMEEQLITLIRMECYMKRISLREYETVLSSVRQSSKYTLLRMICLHGPDVGLDISTIDGLKAISKRRSEWPLTIFLTLRQDHSLSLLRRLKQAQPDGKFLSPQWRDLAFWRATGYETTFPDVAVLMTYLQSGTEEGEAEAQHVVDTLEGKAARSREQTDRASYALSVLFHAIASGSLDLLMHVVLWLRRFQRDPSTVITIHTNVVWTTVECIALLSGIPTNINTTDAATIRSRVAKANSLLIELLQSAVLSLREPSFQASNWTEILSLFRKVVDSRINQAGKLKGRFKMSEDELYETLWPDTLNSLCEAEKVGLKKEHEGLEFHHPGGPLALDDTTDSVKPPLPSSYRFLDNLAESRDKLWQDFRPTVHPAAAALEPPWPKGLPVQCLAASHNLAVESAQDHTPYISQRANNVMLVEPDQTLKRLELDEESAKAIGPFVDSFDFALTFVVLQCHPGQQRDTVVDLASWHAVNRLSRVSMSDRHLRSFWTPVFRRALPGIPLSGFLDTHSEEYPVVPMNSDPVEFREWNPATPPFAKKRRRTIVATALDCMLAAPPQVLWHHKDSFALPSPSVEISCSPIWTFERLTHTNNLAPEFREGLILSALLIQAGGIEGGSNFLASPFPSANLCRFPALFLDGEFLQTMDQLSPPSLDVLFRFIEYVPPKLVLALADLALGMLSKTPLDSTKLIPLERTAYGILRLLSRCDQPQLATNLVTRAILDRPGASSWHRHLLTKNLMRRLAAADAEDFLDSFASEICERVELQASRPEPESEQDATLSSTQPIVKVTTVKLLAQFLDDADFVSPHFAIDILTKLFQKATHIDIRAAVTETVLGKLESSSESASDEFVGRTMKVLQLAVPVIGSLNERRQDGVWEEAERTGRLPEIYLTETRQIDGKVNDLPPILGMVLRAITSHRIKTTSIQKHLINDVLLPALSLSLTENTRWVEMFLLEHPTEDLAFKPPMFPVKPSVLGSLVRHCYSEGEIPDDVLDLHQQWISTIINPPPPLQTQIQKIRKDPSLLDSNEEQHYMSLYGRANITEYTVLSNLLTKQWAHSFDPQGTHLHHVQDLVVRHVSAILFRSGTSFTNFNEFISVLAPPSYTSSQDTKNIWIKKVRPVIYRIIDKIEALRTPEWQRSRQRHPAILPDIYNLELWLWPFPQDSDSLAERCGNFINCIKDALVGKGGVYELGLAYHHRLKSIEDAIMRCSPRERMYIACVVGPSTEQLDHVDDVEDCFAGRLMVKAEVIEGVLKRTEMLGEKCREEGVGEGFSAREAVGGLVEGWKGSIVEEIRTRGFQLSEVLKKG